ncbi:hypothetical protein Tco_0420541 [Tanacetum coccineum]
MRIYPKLKAIGKDEEGEDVDVLFTVTQSDYDGDNLDNDQIQEDVNILEEDWTLAMQEQTIVAISSQRQNRICSSSKTKAYSDLDITLSELDMSRGYYVVKVILM